jgi:hypothetical protein
MATKRSGGSRAKGWQPTMPTSKPAVGGQQGLPKPGGKSSKK